MGRGSCLQSVASRRLWGLNGRLGLSPRAVWLPRPTAWAAASGLSLESLPPFCSCGQLGSSLVTEKGTRGPVVGEGRDRGSCGWAAHLFTPPGLPRSGIGALARPGGLPGREGRGCGPPCTCLGWAGVVGARPPKMAQLRGRVCRGSSQAGVFLFLFGDVAAGSEQVCLECVLPWSAARMGTLGNWGAGPGHL